MQMNREEEESLPNAMQQQLSLLLSVDQPTTQRRFPFGFGKLKSLKTEDSSVIMYTLTSPTPNRVLPNQQKGPT